MKQLVARLVVIAIVYALVGLLLSEVRAADRGPYEVVVERDVKVPMRDGTKLAIDLYIPARDGKPIAGTLPTLLLRTPYNKTEWSPHISRYFASHGYLAAAQDTRGRFASEGTFNPFLQEPEDGYDTIQWLAGHPRSNGRVGMHGPSYMTWVQFEAATQHPPALKTMIPHHGPTNAYLYSMRGGGAMHLGLLKWVAHMAVTGQEASANPDAAAAVSNMTDGDNFLRWAARVPWKQGQTPLAAFPNYERVASRLYFDHPDYDEWWRAPGLGMSEHFDRFPRMPILWVTSWFDWYPRTISDGYQQAVGRGWPNQHLVIGPWLHNAFHAELGDANFGYDNARIRSYDDFLKLELAWFDRWLRDDASVALGSAVHVFEMGGGDGRRGAGGRLNHGGRWRDYDAWPPHDAKPTAFHLHAGRVLSTDPSATDVPPSSYSYDPRDTVSSNGRCIIAYGPSAKAAFSGMGPRDQIDQPTLPGHGRPGRSVADRADVLVFETPPLEADTRITGDVLARLYVSSDAPDTDFYVKLIDQYPASDDSPGGYGFPVTEGILRARFRESFAKPVPMKSGEVYRLEFPLEPTANVFRAGHRIRIYVCSSNFPNFDINPNTGDPNDRTPRVARNSVHHDADHPSAIILPLLPTRAKSP